jgi:antirestriction protein ArdC
LKNDRTLIVQVAAQAQKAADFILGAKFEDTNAN